MFLTLLLVTFTVALAVSALVARAFSRPVDRILARIIADEISGAWRRYLMFAIVVVGVSSGVRIYELERYITPQPCGDKDTQQVLALSTERWVLELYRTIIESMQGIAWLLLVFFVVALVAYVVVRIAESRKGAHPPAPGAGP